MRYTRITSTDHPLFGQAWELYRKSFPPQERRWLCVQKNIMNDPPYHFELVTDKDSFVGFILWWGFEDLRYIEHFATLPELRGKGYGAQILGRFIDSSDVPVLLEVEHPTDEISRRRIGFYERAGFKLNEQLYTHPPYKKGGDSVPLMLMTWPTAITTAALTRFVQEYHTIIHRFVLSAPK